LKRARPRGREVRIERHNPHAESDGAPAEFAADSPHADDAKGLVEELDPFQVFAVPFSAAQKGISLRNFARRAQEQGKSVFRRGNSVAARRVHHDHAPLRRRVDIDIIDPNPSASDNAQPGAGINNRGRDLRLAAHDNSAEFWNDFDQPFLA
jgi:hypothetical protein